MPFALRRVPVGFPDTPFSLRCLQPSGWSHLTLARLPLGHFALDAILFARSAGKFRTLHRTTWQNLETMLYVYVTTFVQNLQNACHVPTQRRQCLVVSLPPNSGDTSSNQDP